jgi:hypothetical protein
LENEIEPLLHSKILDGDNDGCLAISTVIDDDHKPSFLLQQPKGTNEPQKNQESLLTG